MELKEMIIKGLSDGTVRLIQNPNDDCISCEIGEYWFYFIDSEYEEETPDVIFETFTKEELANMIVNAMNELDENETQYYEAILHEAYDNQEPCKCCTDKNLMLWNVLKKHIGHHVQIVYYGDEDDPSDICLECEDCGEVVLDGELYTLESRDDIEE